MWSGGGEETRWVALCVQTHHWGQLDRYLGKDRSGRQVRQESCDRTHPKPKWGRHAEWQQGRRGRGGRGTNRSSWAMLYPKDFSVWSDGFVPNFHIISLSWVREIRWYNLCFLSARSLGCSANILALTREFTYICILHKSPPQKRKKIGFLLSWLDLDEEEILVKGLVHWTKWKLCLVHQCFSRYSQKCKPWLYIETSDL